MELLRDAPGAEIVFEAVKGEEGVYVVGGAVRDALMGRAPKELDLVVEGDAIPVARRAAERVDGSLLVHDRFGTATITGDGFASTSRAPARRPTAPGCAAGGVLGATITEDLARRDFTVNAIAVPRRRAT